MKELFDPENQLGSFSIQNRRYLGNKFKLLNFIEKIVESKCGNMTSFCDIFAGTGVVGEHFNSKDIQIISNDLLHSNYTCLKAFLETTEKLDLSSKLYYLNNLEATQDNYFSINFGGSYFSKDNAKKIGAIRKEIDSISENEVEKSLLICSLIYAADRLANTVGHYDAYRRVLDKEDPIILKTPNINESKNLNNKIYNMDANSLIESINCNVLYIDPPYNSRQYSDSYHLLDNLSEWKKPKVYGIGKKMDRAHIKSKYCSKDAAEALEDLICKANCQHILLSYNNTGDSINNRSNARVSDDSILNILKSKGQLTIFEEKYKRFNSKNQGNADLTERIFYCEVKK